MKEAEPVGVMVTCRRCNHVSMVPVKGPPPWDPACLRCHRQAGSGGVEVVRVVFKHEVKKP